MDKRSKQRDHQQHLRRGYFSLFNSFAIILFAFLSMPRNGGAFVSRACTTRAKVSIDQHIPRLVPLLAHEPTQVQKDDATVSRPIKHAVSRRDALLAATAAAAVLVPMVASASDVTSSDGLEELELGQGRWAQCCGSNTPLADISIVPPTFATYATRFLLQYDKGVSSWWCQSCRSYSLLSSEEQQSKLGRCFGSLAMSIQLGLEEFLKQGGNVRQRTTELAQLFLDKYGKEKDAKRQIGLLFSILPPEYQPTIMNQFASKSIDRALEDSAESEPLDPPGLADDFASLLPANYKSVYVKETSSNIIYPPLRLYEVGVDDEFGQSAVATEFGPLSSKPLKRGRPEYSFDVYALFGISGGAGCALTHSIVIPLDVVKTRMQTDPGQYNSMLDGATQIVKEEGPKGLLLGAQATVAGYLWYGISVYPSYTFFKRFIGQSLLAPEVAAIHANDVALIAGALAAVIASLGLTPLEACRIRTVAEPDTYRPIGLLGTLDAISKEDPELGWKTLYAGLPSLLTRQVIFGSVKFLAFERACEAIFAFFPVLRDATWTSLTVSLVAGGFSGALSSVVSQPADSVLTYVAQKSGESSLGVIDGCRIMIEEEGVGSLFRGLGSRCVWAGSIIAGQFLLYDVFRTYFGVNGDDLSQVYKVVISGSNSGLN